MRDPQEMLGLFESLGDNCEFGFVQRKYGLDPGGLLRWAISQVSPLTAALKGRFEGFYEFDDLSPSADDMVLAQRYGLFFHTSMQSKVVDGQRAFVEPADRRRELYDIEIQKMNYMRTKLLEKLVSGKSTFIYKSNIDIDNLKIEALLDSLYEFNSGNRLLAVKLYPEPRPVEVLKTHLYMGYIDRFAPYNKADDASYDRWLDICNQTLDLIER